MELSGAVGCEQIKKLPGLIAGRHRNANIFRDVLENHPLVSIQKEIGVSSWFGFSLVVRPEADFSRDQLRAFLDAEGFEYRPIVAGNFAEQEVLKYMNYEIFGSLKSASHIQNNGLFIGNHHYDVGPALRTLARL